MGIEFNGQEIETTGNGYLVNNEDWSKELASHMASSPTPIGTSSSIFVLSIFISSPPRSTRAPSSRR